RVLPGRVAGPGRAAEVIQAHSHRRPDDDGGADRRRRRGPAGLRRAAPAARPAPRPMGRARRVAAPVDGHDARLRSRHRGGRDAGADRLGTLRGAGPVMTRWLALLYGLACYALTGAAVLYFAAFLNDAGLPRSLNRGPESSPAVAVGVDLA